MNVRIVFVILAMFCFTVGFCQNNKEVVLIDKIVAEIDSITKSAVNIAEFIHPLYADDGGELWLKNHCFLDTTKRILYKCIYDRIGFEQVTFYYHNQSIVKAIIADSSLKSRPFKGEYYFDNDSTILSNEQGEWNHNCLWNKKELIDSGKHYLLFFKGICDMLDKRK
jgi:hypothetical protein